MSAVREWAAAQDKKLLKICGCRNSCDAVCFSVAIIMVIVHFMRKIRRVIVLLKLKRASSTFCWLEGIILEPSIDTDKLSYEVFSILETNFLLGYGGNHDLWIPREAPDGEGKGQRGRICILSVDGGGMPGASSARALSYLESALKSKSGNPDARIADYFDVAAGTGVGGIFVAMLFGSKDGAAPIFRAEEIGKFVSGEVKKLFRKRRGLLGRLFGRKTGGGGGASAGMKAAFRDEKTGRSLTLKDTLKPVLIPCYDLSTAAPFLFSRADALESDSFDFSLWEVCSATAAEPGLFGPVCMKSADGSVRCVAIDGRVVMSNPAAAAMTHVLHNKQEFPLVRGVEDMIVVSIGAESPPAMGRFDCDEAKKWNGEEWVKALGQISGESSAELVDQAVAMAFGQSRDSNYVRIQANGSETGEETLKLRNVESVLLGGRRIGEQTNAEKLDWIAEQLVLENQLRSSRVVPTVTLKKAKKHSG